MNMQMLSASGLAVAVIAGVAIWGTSRNTTESPTQVKVVAQSATPQETQPTKPRLTPVTHTEGASKQVLDELGTLKRDLRSTENRADVALELLRQELRELKSQMLVLGDQSTMPRDVAESAQIEVPSVEEVIDMHEDTFAQQIEDSSWGRDEADVLLDHLVSEPIEGISVTAVECREIACRMEFELEQEDAADRFLARVGLPPFDKGGFHYTSEDGLGMIVFTGREGFPLSSGDAM